MAVYTNACAKYMLSKLIKTMKTQGFHYAALLLQ